MPSRLLKRRDAARREAASERISDAIGSGSQVEETWPSPARGWWAVCVLTLAYVVSFVDRSILSLLIEPVRLDLALSDTQIALVQGLAFAIFYSLMGLPLGWLADRYSRRAIIVAGLAVWCLATAGSGLAGGFLALFMARLFVGAGEAALSPAAMSMLSDLFPPERRGAPIGVYTMSAALGSGLAMIVGGAVIQAVSRQPMVSMPLLGEVKPWQATFMVVGLAGLALVPMLATVGEPRRRRTPQEARHGTPGSGMLAFLIEHRGFYACHYLGVGLLSALVYAVPSWTPVMFMRVHGWTAAETGLRYGLAMLIFGGAGPVLSGWLASRLFRRGVPAASVKIVVAGCLLVVPFTAIACFTENPWLAIAMLGPGSMFLTVPMSTAMLAVQEVTPHRLRAQFSALYYVFSSIIGLSVGPLAVALLTERAFGRPDAVGSAIGIVVAIFGPLAAWLVSSGHRHYLAMTSAISSGHPGFPSARGASRIGP